MSYILGCLLPPHEKTGCPADLLNNQTVQDPNVHGHTSRAPPVGIEPSAALATDPSLMEFDEKAHLVDVYRGGRGEMRKPKSAAGNLGRVDTAVLFACGESFLQHCRMMTRI
jgi:hypothetical protein